jgi:hypothetical protein
MTTIKIMDRGGGYNGSLRGQLRGGLEYSGGSGGPIGYDT